ncbi:MULTISPECIES: hypothetical protein [Cytobacillus]|nr:MULTISPECIES: hypothetical protein [Cytobacillus]
MNILVFKRNSILSHVLLGNGHDVTIATRGQTADDFADYRWAG